MIEHITVLNGPNTGLRGWWYRCPTCGWFSEWSIEGFGMKNECPDCRQDLHLVKGTRAEWTITKGVVGSLKNISPVENTCGTCIGPDCEGCPKLPVGSVKGPGARDL